jgi:hypothetical protein
LSKEDIEVNLDSMKVDNCIRLCKSILSAKYVKDAVDGWIKSEFTNNYIALIGLEEEVSGGKHAILMEAIRQDAGGAKIFLMDPLPFLDSTFAGELECLLDSLKYETNVIYTGRQDKDFGTCGDVCLIIAQELLENHIPKATEKASTFLLKFSEVNNEVRNFLALPDIIENVFDSSGHCNFKIIRKLTI